MNVQPTYHERNLKRQQTLEEATMNFVGYFMQLGDDQATADQKVSDVSTESAALIYPYILGNKRPLIDAINASNLPFMDANAKAAITDYLTNPQ